MVHNSAAKRASMNRGSDSVHASTPDHSGRPYRDYDSFCLEAQQLPDSPNRPELGDPWLLPGQLYHHQTRYRLIPAG